jgi:hypothetical protein
MHSDKALTTLARMGTTPAQWRPTPIEWREERREVPGMVTCPTCLGRKFVRIADGSVVPPPAPDSPEDFAYRNDARRQAVAARMLHGNCPTCAKRTRGWGMVPQGKVRDLVVADVMVGYPKFPPGTCFDSQFHAGSRCGLCNKLILKSRRVPVHARGDDGVTHGMFVGEDCARKFLDVRIEREDDAIVEG